MNIFDKITWFDKANYSYSKHFREPYKKPHYRMTIIPHVQFWEITHIWVLKHWGKERIKAACDGGYQHKFCRYAEILYYRIDEE